MAHIPFIPPTKASSSNTRIHPSFSGHDDAPPRFITFSEGVPAEHEVLVWTSTYLLPDWADPFQLTEHNVSRSDADGEVERSLDDYRQRIAELLGVCRYRGCRKRFLFFSVTCFCL